MEKYPKLFYKITKELNEIEEKLSKYKKQVSFVENEYNQLKNKVDKFNLILKELEEERNKKLYSQDTKINTIILILSLIIFSSAVLLCKLLSMNLLTIIIVTSIIGFVEFKFLKKIIKVIKNKIHNIIIDSAEYQDLLNKIKEQTNQLDLVQKQIIDKQVDMNNAKSLYNLTLAERNMKRSLILHLKNETNSLSSNNNNIQTKPYTRTKTKNNNGNIQQ